MPDSKEVIDALEALAMLCVASKVGLKISKDALGRSAQVKVLQSPSGMVSCSGESATAPCTLQSHTSRPANLFSSGNYYCVLPRPTQVSMGDLLVTWTVAVDTQWDLETRRSAIASLKVLCRLDSTWKRCTKTDQVIFNMPTTVISNDGPNFEVPLVPHLATHGLVAALDDSSDNVRDSAASALGEQSSLSKKSTTPPSSA
ncbi:unnamed protein product [Mortierella alpina]